MFVCVPRPWPKGGKRRLFLTCQPEPLLIHWTGAQTGQAASGAGLVGSLHSFALHHWARINIWPQYWLLLVQPASRESRRIGDDEVVSARPLRLVWLARSAIPLGPAAPHPPHTYTQRIPAAQVNVQYAPQWVCVFTNMPLPREKIKEALAASAVGSASSWYFYPPSLSLSAAFFLHNNLFN